MISKKPLLPGVPGYLIVFKVIKVCIQLSQVWREHLSTRGKGYTNCGDNVSGGGFCQYFCFMKDLCLYLISSIQIKKFHNVIQSVVDPDFQLKRGPSFVLLAQPAFLPSVISSLFTQNRAGGGALRSPGPLP